MGIYDYLALDNEEQWDVLWDKGIFVDAYKSIDCSYQLFAIDKFFVEVELDITNDSILGKSVFKEGKRLDKYSGDIKVKPAPWD